MARWSHFLVVLVLFSLTIATGLIASELDSSVQVKASSDSIEDNPLACDLCLAFSIDAERILTNPDTQKQAVHALSQYACGQLHPASLKGKCNDMVKTYIPEILSALQSYLGADMCTQVGLCPKSELLMVQDKKICSLCEVFATDALMYLGSNRTKAQIITALHLACAKLDDLSRQCDMLVDIYALEFMEHLNDVTPEQFCLLAHFCKPPALKMTLKRNDCAICQFVVLELKIKLKDPKTQEKLLETLISGCNRVPNHVDECKLIIEEYGPFILANLDTLLDAETLCKKIGACHLVTQTGLETTAFQPLILLPSESQVQ